MDGAAFRQITITEASGHATPTQEDWLRSPEVCERWRETLRQIGLDCNKERVDLDRWLDEIRQRAQLAGGGAEYHQARQEHARRIQAVSKVIRVVQARRAEADRICAANKPSPLPPSPVAPELASETLDVSGPPTAVKRVRELKQELAVANAENAELRRKLGKAQANATEATALRGQVKELQDKLMSTGGNEVARQKALNLQIHAERTAYRTWGKTWRAIARQAEAVCRTALEQEQARAGIANLALIGLLSDTIRTAEAGPEFPDVPPWQTFLPNVETAEIGSI